MLLISIGYTGSGKTSWIYALWLLSRGEHFGITSVDVGFTKTSGRPDVILGPHMSNVFIKAIEGIKNEDEEAFNIIKTNPAHVYEVFSTGRVNEYQAELSLNGKSATYVDSVGAVWESAMRILIGLSTLSDLSIEEIIDVLSKAISKASSKVRKGNEWKAREGVKGEFKKDDQLRSFIDLAVTALKYNDLGLMESFIDAFPIPRDRYQALLNVFFYTLPHMLRSLKENFKKEELTILAFIPSTTEVMVIPIDPRTFNYSIELTKRTFSALGFRIRKTLNVVSFGSRIRYPKEFWDEFDQRYDELEHGERIPGSWPSMGKPVAALREQYIIDLWPRSKGRPGEYVPLTEDGKIVHVNVQRLLEMALR